MYKITVYFLLYSVLGFAQNINFADPDLLVYLTTKPCVDMDGDGSFESTADFNSDGQIQLSEALQVVNFRFNSEANNIQDITGFENFSQLQRLEVTTIDIPHLDLSVWQSLQWLRLSSSIDSFVFDNPLLTHFELQNVGFNNPVFDLTNLPNLEYVRVQSSFLTNNLIFGTHNNLEELRILAGTFSTLNLMQMPALKYLTVADYVGATLNISNCTQLEEFIFRYDANLVELIGDNASNALSRIDFSQEDYLTIPSSLELQFNDQNLVDIQVYGVKSFSLSNNTTNLGNVRLFHINESVQIHNCQFANLGSGLDASLWLQFFDESEIDFNNVLGVNALSIQDLNTDLPVNLSATIAESLQISSCTLNELILKNGVAQQSFFTDSQTVIQYICIDSDELGIVENGYGNPGVPPVINTYCSFPPGGEFYLVKGDMLLDLGSGCAVYPEASIFDVQFTVTDGTTTQVFYPGSDNDYVHYVPEGNYTVSGELADADYWTLDPSSFNVSFPADASPYVQDICITPNGSHNDLEIVILPMSGAIAGFQTDYKIVFKNKGNTPLSGSIDLTFNGDVMDFLMSNPLVHTQTEESLRWNYVNLLPLEAREINFSMELNPPTDPDFPLNIGDILVYSATINPVAADETPEDNSFDFYQEVTNSYDPNDIQCLEGDGILLEQVGEYVHYLIRFENLGTANAVNVVVKDVLDTTKFDLSSMMPMAASHTFYTRIVNGNEVEFIFENINLPFTNNNNGYVLFKVKTWPTLELGDSFHNQAEIFFDFNFPIITNTATTFVVEEILAIPEIDVKGVLLAPNPTNGIVQITCPSNATGIGVYDANGRRLEIAPPTATTTGYQLDISNLARGLYFVEIQWDTAKQVVKCIKK